MSEIRRWAHIEDEVVTTISLWDGETPWNPGCEIVEIEEGSSVGPGWTRVGNKFIPPEIIEV